MPFVPAIFVFGDAGAAATNRASSALAMFVALVFLLGLFMAGLVLIWAARRMRRPPATKQSATPVIDPWKESARRLEPFPREDSSGD